jgi:hypothetical protein
MEQPPSLVEQFTARLKNNRFVAVLIVIGVIVISLASFTDALMRLVSVTPNFRQTVINGQWESDVLKDVRTGLEFRYSFSLRSDGVRLYGNAVRLAPYCQEHRSDGVCAGYGDPVPILDGKFERNALSFLCDWGELPGSAPFTWIETKETFRGALEGKKIRLVLQDDQNSPTVEFTVTQATKPASDLAQ